MANSEDQNQMPHSVASDQGLNCLQIVQPFFLGQSKSDSLTYLKLKFNSFNIRCGGSLFSLKWLEARQWHDVVSPTCLINSGLFNMCVISGLRWNKTGYVLDAKLPYFHLLWTSKLLTILSAIILRVNMKYIPTIKPPLKSILTDPLNNSHLKIATDSKLNSSPAEPRYTLSFQTM